jgi:hypothetical protein
MLPTSPLSPSAASISSRSPTPASWRPSPPSSPPAIESRPSVTAQRPRRRTKFFAFRASPSPLFTVRHPCRAPQWPTSSIWLRTTEMSRCWHVRPSRGGSQREWLTQGECHQTRPWKLAMQELRLTGGMEGNGVHLWGRRENCTNKWPFGSLLHKPITQIFCYTNQQLLG